ncbi:hypothetical protein R1sor_014245 [Riccia sorocarpa]|uniref:DNA mismatch repair proteins mutS family domain-containing protein n=1 Tax=Riccia sorocarpa TaxID=122646 RepID=A0ABD3HAP3_9MARC
MPAQIDVLISFASTIIAANGPTCRSQFVPSRGLGEGGSVLQIKSLWHPYASGGLQGSFVPNDIECVSESRNVPHAMLLTGPNMGGKSTLLRATCLAVILAQLGCYVPGEASILSPVDTIFTRLGASDRIMAGENLVANSSIQVPSWVECNEASSVLNHATSDSLVIFDELGRGTSTYDGYAIAYTVSNKHTSYFEEIRAFSVLLPRVLDCKWLYVRASLPPLLNLRIAQRRRCKSLFPHTFCMDDKSAELGANIKQLLHTVLRAGNHRAGLESSSRKNQTHEQILGAWQTLQNEQDAVKG